jgi:hypothetical protein
MSHIVNTIDEVEEYLRTHADIPDGALPLNGLLK